MTGAVEMAYRERRRYGINGAASRCGIQIRNTIDNVTRAF
jgi:hypothetical protein